MVSAKRGNPPLVPLPLNKGKINPVSDDLETEKFRKIGRLIHVEGAKGEVQQNECAHNLR